MTDTGRQNAIAFYVIVSKAQHDMIDRLCAAEGITKRELFARMLDAYDPKQGIQAEIRKLETRLAELGGEKP